MKSALFIVSIIFLALSAAFYFSAYNVRMNNNNYWGDLVNTDGVWLNNENHNIEAFRLTEQVKGGFSGTDVPSNQDKDLLVVRLVDSIDNTDYKVTIPRLYNADKVTVSPNEIVTKLTNPGSAVITLVTNSSKYSVFMDSIFFPPTQ